MRIIFFLFFFFCLSNLAHAPLYKVKLRTVKKKGVTRFSVPDVCTVKFVHFNLESRHKWPFNMRATVKRRVFLAPCEPARPNSRLKSNRATPPRKIDSKKINRVRAPSKPVQFKKKYNFIEAPFSGKKKKTTFNPSREDDSLSRIDWWTQLYYFISASEKKSFRDSRFNPILKSSPSHS